jgi:hypothetical protein
MANLAVLACVVKWLTPDQPAGDRQADADTCDHGAWVVWRER